VVEVPRVRNPEARSLVAAVHRGWGHQRQVAADLPVLGHTFLVGVERIHRAGVGPVLEAGDHRDRGPWAYQGHARLAGAYRLDLEEACRRAAYQVADHHDQQGACQLGLEEVFHQVGEGHRGQQEEARVPDQDRDPVARRGQAPQTGTARRPERVRRATEPVAAGQGSSRPLS
jgi:hypothetical protein